MIHQKPCDNFIAPPKSDKPPTRDTDDVPHCVTCRYPFRSHPQKPIDLVGNARCQLANLPDNLKEMIGSLGLCLTFLEDEKGEIVTQLDPVEIRAVHNIILSVHSEFRKGLEK